MSKGWILLYRSIRETPLWGKTPFDPPRAWIDLLLRASATEREVIRGWGKVSVKPGELLFSRRRLARDWEWGEEKVRNFLKFLEKTEGSIAIDSKQGRKWSRMTILNWTKYQRPKRTKSSVYDTTHNNKQQPSGTHSKQHTKEQASQPEPGRVHNKEVGKKTEEVNNNSPDPRVERVFEFWKETFGKGDRVKLTIKRQRKIKARLKDFSEDDLKAAITACSESDYHNGDNERGRLYIELSENILRSHEQTEKWLTDWSPKDTRKKSKPCPDAARVTAGHPCAGKRPGDEWEDEQGNRNIIRDDRMWVKFTRRIPKEMERV